MKFIKSALFFIIIIINIFSAWGTDFNKLNSIYLDHYRTSLNLGLKYSDPVSGDFNNDNKMDFIIVADKEIHYFQYSGLDSLTHPYFDELTISIPSLNLTYASATAVDLNNDGYDDLAIGLNTGEVAILINDGITPLSFTLKDTLDTLENYKSSPTFLDIDNDNDADLLVGIGKQSGKVVVFRNKSTGTGASFSSNFTIETGYLFNESVPYLNNVSRIINNTSKYILTSSNTGGKYTYKFTPAFSGSGDTVPFTEIISSFSLVSLQAINSIPTDFYPTTTFFQDFDLSLPASTHLYCVTGSRDGTLRLYESSSLTTNLSLKTGYFLFLDLGNNTSGKSIDINSDGLMDLAIGFTADRFSFLGTLTYFKGINSEEPGYFSFVSNLSPSNSQLFLTPDSSVVNGLNVEFWNYNPKSSGTSDLFLGTSNATLALYSNDTYPSNDTNLTKLYSGSNSNSFDSILGYSFGGNITPRFKDIDGDGDSDCVFLAEQTTYLGLYENQMINSSNKEVRDWLAGDFQKTINGHNSTDSISPVQIYNGSFDMFDFEGDGDFDILYSTLNNNPKIILNNGTPTSYSFSTSQLSLSLLSNATNLKNISASDFDYDGWTDIIAGSTDGGLVIFLNNSSSYPDNSYPAFYESGYSFTASTNNGVRIDVVWSPINDNSKNNYNSPQSGTAKYIVYKYSRAKGSTGDWSKYSTAAIIKALPSPLLLEDTDLLSTEAEYLYLLQAVDAVGNYTPLLSGYFNPTNPSGTAKSTLTTAEVSGIDSRNVATVVTNGPPMLTSLTITSQPSGLQGPNIPITLSGTFNYATVDPSSTTTISIVPTAAGSLTFDNGLTSKTFNGGGPWSFDLTYSNSSPLDTEAISFYFSSTTPNETLTTSTVNLTVDVKKPDSPADTTVTDSLSNYKDITLSWNPFTDTNGSGVSHYKIIRLIKSGSSFTQNSVFDNYIPSNMNAPTFKDTTTDYSKTYKYEIYCVDNVGNNSNPLYSNEITTDDNPFIPPTSPVFNESSIVVGDDYISLNWTSSLAQTNGSTIATYILERSNNNIDYLPVDGINGEVGVYTTYMDNNLTPGNYYYRVRSKDSNGLTSVGWSYTGPHTVGTISDTTPPVITNFSVTSGGIDSIDIFFNATDTQSQIKTVTFYDVTEGGETLIKSYTESTTNPPSSVSKSFSYTNLTPNTTYSIKAVVTNGDTLSAIQTKSATTDDDGSSSSVKPVIEGLTSVDNTVRFFWNTPTHPDGFTPSTTKVYRSKDGSIFLSILVYGGKYLDLFEDKNLSPGLYKYKVGITYSNNVEYFSDETAEIQINEVVADTTPPTKPKNIRGEPTATSIKFSWDASTDASGVDYYEIQLGISTGSIFPSFAGYDIIKLTNLSYTFEDLLPNTKYAIRVRATDKVGNTSAFETYKYVETLNIDDNDGPETPTNLKLSGVASRTKVIINWDKVEDLPLDQSIGVKGYNIYKSNTFDGIVKGSSHGTSNPNYIGFTDNSSEIPTFTDYSLNDEDAHYFYYIDAVDKSDNYSEFSENLDVYIPIQDDTNNPPSTPVNFTLSKGKDGIQLKWDLSYDRDGISKYSLYKSVNGGDFELYITTNFTNIIDNDVNDGNTYSYKLMVTDNSGLNSSIIESAQYIYNENDSNLNNTVYFPHVDISNGWWTGFNILNNNDVTNNLTYTFYDKDGNEILNSGEKYSFPQFNSIAPHERLVMVVNQLFESLDQEVPEGLSWFKIEGSNPLNGFELFGTGDFELLSGVKLENNKTSNLLFPVGNLSDTSWTGLSIVNLGDLDTKLNLKGYNSEGALIFDDFIKNKETSENIILQSNSKFVDVVSNIVPEEIYSQLSYFVISSESENNIIGFELFGDWSIKTLSGYNGIPLTTPTSHNKKSLDKQMRITTDSPKNLTIENAINTTVTLSWEDPNWENGITPDSFIGFRVHYVVEVPVIGGSSKIYIDDNDPEILAETKDNTVTITNLKENQKLSLAVAAVYDSNSDPNVVTEYYSNFSNIVEVTTTQAIPSVEKYIKIIPITYNLNTIENVYLLNKSNSSNKVKLIFRDKDGETIEVTPSTDISLNANEKKEIDLSSYNLPNIENGSIEFIAEKSIETFKYSSANETLLDSFYGCSIGYDSLEWSHIADSTWNSELTLMNMSNNYTDSTLTIYYIDESENISNVEIQLDYLKPFEIKTINLSSLNISADLLETLQSPTSKPWIEIKSNYPINGYFQFGQNDKITSSIKF